MNSLELLIDNAEWIATVIAIILGPIVAVFITRSLDRKRAKTDRQYSVLSDLMRTRRARLDPAHVFALNLVELEFYGDAKVRKSFREYVRHLNSVWPTDAKDLPRHTEEGDDLFAELLKELANSLGYNFDKRDLDRLGYLPTGLGNQHSNQLANSQYLREVFEGRRSIPIAGVMGNDGQLTPPPKQISVEKETGEPEVSSDGSKKKDSE